MLDATQTINGAFGKLYHEGQWLSNVTGVELNIDINYEEVARAGTRKLGNKATTISSTGTIQSFKISHDFIKAISQIMDDSKGAFVTELITEINDPESPQSKAFIRVKGVQFNTIPLLNYEHGSIVEEELQFVFDDFEYL